MIFSNRFVVLLPLLFSTVIWGQDYRGRVQGVISDSTNAAVVQATVTLVNTNTKTATTRTTDETGRYLFDFVEPGTYSLTAEASGFGKFVQENIQVLVRSDITVNASMKVGDLSQTITVADTAVEIQFNTTTLSQTIDGTMLKELPVLARNPFTLALLDPAVVNRYSDVSKRNPFYQLSSTGVDVPDRRPQRSTDRWFADWRGLARLSRHRWMPSRNSRVQQNSVDANLACPQAA